MRALVTGSLGFVGSHLSAHLARRGRRGLRRRPRRRPTYSTRRGWSASSAPTDPRSCTTSAGGADVGGSWRDPAGTWEANATATLHLLEAAAGPTACDGSCWSRAPTCTARSTRTSSRSTRPPRSAPTSPYAASKVAAEQLALPGLARLRPGDHPGPGVQPPRPRPGRPLRGPGARRAHRPATRRPATTWSRSATSRPAATSPTCATWPAPTGCSWRRASPARRTTCARATTSPSRSWPSAGRAWPSRRCASRPTPTATGRSTSPSCGARTPSSAQATGWKPEIPLDRDTLADVLAEWPVVRAASDIATQASDDHT